MNRLLIRLIAFEKKHVKLCLAAVFLLLILSLFVVISPRYSTDMLEMFSPHSQTRKILSDSLDSGLLNNVSIYFSHKDGTAFNASEDLSFIAETAKKLQTADPGIIDVFWSSNQISMQAGVLDYMEHVPQLFPPDVLLEKKNAELEKTLKKCYRQLAFIPVGGRRIAGADPFSLTSNVWQKLEKLLRISGRKLASDSKFLMSEDHKFCFIMLRTNISAADIIPSRSLLARIEGCLDSVPSQIQTEVFSAHTHTIDNQKGIMRDLWIFSCTSAVLFFLLFFFVYKNDWHGLLIPLLATFACVFALAVMVIGCRKILIFTLGIGGVLIGLGVDYGIHLYAVSRSKMNFRKTLHLIPPLFFAYLTTACAFCSFIFTQVPAFVQFGFFAILMLTFTFLLMLLIIPGVSIQSKSHKIFSFHYLDRLYNYPQILLAASLILLGILVYGCSYFKFRADILDFDFSHIMHGERENICRRAFISQKHPDIILCTQPDEAALFSVMSENLELIKQQVPEAEIISPLDFTLPDVIKKRNLAQWQKCYKNGMWMQFRSRFESAAGKYDFEPAFFNDFFCRIEHGIRNPPSGPPILLSFPINSMVGTGKSTRISGICFLRSPRDISGLKIKGHFISEHSITSQICDDLLGKLPMVAWVTLGFILVCIFIYLKSIPKTLYALLPIVCSIIAIIGLHGLCDKDITPAVLVSCIITIGISVDYGIIVSSYPAEKIKELITPLSLSAITTVIGGLTVIFTKHPMLYSAGITIISGITSAWFCALFFVPCLKYKLHGIKIQKTLLIAVTLLPLIGLVTGCAYQPFGTIDIKPVAAAKDCRNTICTPCEFEASCVFDYPFGQKSFLIVGKTDGTKYSMAVLSLSGAKFIELSGTQNSIVENKRTLPVISSEQARYLGEKIYRAFTCYFTPIQLTATYRIGNHGECICGNAPYKIIFSGTPPETIFKSNPAGYIWIYPEENHKIRFMYSEPWKLFGIFVKMKLHKQPEEPGKNV